MVDGKRRFEKTVNALNNYTHFIFKKALTAASPRQEVLDLLRSISRMLNQPKLTHALGYISWHGKSQNFYIPATSEYFNADANTYEEKIAPIVNDVDTTALDAFNELMLRAYLQLTGDVINQFVQFEHIQPLLKRMESSLNSLQKVITVQDTSQETKLLTVISLKRCNSETKKVLPLLIAKHFYNEHKDNVDNPPDQTAHLIIDEAHNILSQQSSRESESWKDYRLELFEEIIKEGRKFGVFITLSSQRPADISPTIISQLHNFFIHRLVNDRDLFLIDNTITTLDSLSRGLIPSLAKGCCVATGTAFDLPMVMQIDVLQKEKQPDSEDVDLVQLWAC